MSAISGGSGCPHARNPAQRVFPCRIEQNDGVSNELEPETTTPEQDARFEQMFGISRVELRAQGVDENTYVREHLSEAMEKNGPASYRLRSRYYAWRLRTLLSFIVLCLVAAILGGANGPLKSHDAVRVIVSVGCVVIMAGVVLGDVKARRRYRRAMKEEAAHDQIGTSTTGRGEFRSTVATLGRGRFVISIPVSYLAEVTVHKGRLTLRQRSNGKVFAEVDVSAVIVSEPRIFLGAGVKLDLGDAGQWVVGFSQRYGLLDDARATTRRFIQALRDGQSGPR